ncbi:MAG: DUF1223 domain-containing protein [Pseudomonadota bacterium]
MRQFLISLILGTLSLTPVALASERIVLIELFTSQGCNSCPPADEILRDISDTHDDVLALSLHVDYWDYLGWKDIFAQPQFKSRQAAYNEQIKSRYSLVTPQIVFDGQAQVAGGHTIKIFEAMNVARAGQDRAALNLVATQMGLRAEITPMQGSRAADVYLVRFTQSEDVAIAAGENGGKKLTYTNVVKEWTKIGEWDGTSEARFSADIAGDDKTAVIVQVAGSGPVLAARKLQFAGN